MAMWRCAPAIALALSMLPGCSRGAPEASAPLPGHSRPVLDHGWPNPRDYQFKPSTFQPPNVSNALFTTNSSVRAYVFDDAADPLVRVTVALPLGRLDESRGEAGAAALLTELLRRRGPTRGPGSLSLQLESMGAQLDVEESPDVTRMSIEVLREDWREALELLVHLVRRPALDQSLIAKYRTPPGYSFPTSYVFEAGPVPSPPGEFRPKVEVERALGGYPLSPPEPGLAVAPSAVRSLANWSCAANRVVLGIGGGIAPAEVQAALEELTAGWESVSDTREELPVVERSGGGLVSTVDAESLEGWIAIGRSIGAIPGADRAPLALLAEILGTRLNVAVREIRGLANRTVCLLPSTGSGKGLLHVRTGGRAEAVAPLVKFCQEEIARMYNPDDPVTGEELEVAKGALLLGTWQTSLDGARSASSTLAVELVRRAARAGCCSGRRRSGR